MLRLVSVDPDLESVKQYLSNCGYQVVDSETWMRPVEAVVYSGQPLSGDGGSSPAAAENTVLVNANGLTPEEVALQLENRLN